MERRLRRMPIYEDVRFQNKKMVRKKKKHSSNPRKNIALNLRKMQCLPPNVISTVAEETSKFAMKEPTFEWRKKKQNKKRGQSEESLKLHDERYQSLPPE
ncbi:hypothetical protein TNCV_3688981 [Trichonephila clavipes]|nr:hypothetical protein TNCV_3688981 [Trichonephila clavipes]